MNITINPTSPLASLLPQLRALVEPMQWMRNIQEFQIIDGVLLAGQRGFDFRSRHATPEQTAAFDAVVAQIGPLLEAKAAADAAEAARIAALPPPVPESITPRQLRIFMLTHGMDPDQLTALCNAIDDPLQKRIALANLEYSTEIRRDNALVAQFAADLGLTSAQIDQAFRDASQL